MHYRHDQDVWLEFTKKDVWLENEERDASRGTGTIHLWLRCTPPKKMVLKIKWKGSGYRICHIMSILGRHITISYPKWKQIGLLFRRVWAQTHWTHIRTSISWPNLFLEHLKAQKVLSQSFFCKNIGLVAFPDDPHSFGWSTDLLSLVWVYYSFKLVNLQFLSEMFFYVQIIFLFTLITYMLH